MQCVLLPCRGTPDRGMLPFRNNFRKVRRSTSQKYFVDPPLEGIILAEAIRKTIRPLPSSICSPFAVWDLEKLFALRSGQRTTMVVLWLYLSVHFFSVWWRAQTSYELWFFMSLSCPSPFECVQMLRWRNTQRGSVLSRCATSPTWCTLHTHIESYW